MEDEHSEGTERINWKLNIVLALFFLAILIASIFAARSLTNYVSNQNEISMMSIVSSSVFSFMLFMVYASMLNDQSRQTNSIKRQERLIEEQASITKELNRPRLQIEGFRSADFEESRYSSQAVEIKLSNIGKSPATDIQLKITTAFPVGSEYSPADSLSSTRKKKIESGWRQNWHTYIEAGESGAIILAEPLMLSWQCESGKIERKALEFVHTVLEEDQIRVKAVLTYSGPDEDYECEVFDRIGKVSPYMSVSEFIDKGSRAMNYDKTFPIEKAPGEGEE